MDGNIERRYAPRRKFTDAEKKAILEAYADRSLTRTVICEKFGIKQHHIDALLKAKGEK